MVLTYEEENMLNQSIGRMLSRTNTPKEMVYTYDLVDNFHTIQAYCQEKQFSNNLKRVLRIYQDSEYDIKETINTIIVKDVLRDSVIQCSINLLQRRKYLVLKRTKTT